MFVVRLKKFSRVAKCTFLFISVTAWPHLHNQSGNFNKSLARNNSRRFSNQTLNWLKSGLSVMHCILFQPV
jgi:hypothetical protein